MGKLGMATGEPITHSLLTKSLINAQKRVEDRNFEIRKHLLEYDDVITKQRDFIYAQRNSILEDTAIKDRILIALEEYLTFLLEGAKSSTVSNVFLNEVKFNFCLHA